MVSRMTCPIATRIHIFPLCSLSLFIYLFQSLDKNQKTVCFFLVLCIYLVRVAHESSGDMWEYFTPALQFVEEVKPKPTKVSHCGNGMPQTSWVWVAVCAEIRGKTTILHYPLLYSNFNILKYIRKCFCVCHGTTSFIFMEVLHRRDIKETLYS